MGGLPIGQGVFAAHIDMEYCDFYTIPNTVITIYHSYYLRRGFKYVESGSSCSCESYYYKSGKTHTAVIEKDRCKGGSKSNRCRTVIKVTDVKGEVAKVDEPSSKEDIKLFLERYDLFN